MGQTRKRIDIGGLILTETMHSPNQRLARHRHDLANLLFVIDGSFNENIDGRTESCGRLGMFIRPAEQLHSNEYDSNGTRCLIIGIEPGWHGLADPLSSVLERPSLTRNSVVAGLGLKLRREMMVADAASTLSIEGVLLELLAEGIRSSVWRGERHPSWLGRVHEILHDDFSSSHRIESIARQVGVHPVHLARSFRRYHGCTIGEYSRRLRIEFAERQLAMTDTSLAEIALNAGFCAQSHFSTVFKSHFGLTPTQYRAALGISRR